MVTRFLLTIFGLALASLNGIHSAHADPLSVTLLMSEDSAPYQEFREGLQSQLTKFGITLQSEQQGIPPETDLVVVVGSKKLSEVIQQTNLPVIAAFVSKESYGKLLRDFPKRTSGLTAVFLDQPIERQLALLRQSLKKATHIGLLYSHPPYEIKGLRAKAGELGLVLHEHDVGSPGELPAALNAVLQKSEAILALPDTEIYNASTIRNILLASYRAEVPIVGFSASFVRAGAVCAVFTTPTQLAAQAASAIKQFAETKSLPPAQYAHDFEVHVNEQVARSLGLNMPSAAELKKMIGERK